MQLGTEFMSYWYVKLVIIVLLTLCGNYAARFVIKASRRFFEASERKAHNIFVKSITPPTHFIIMLIGASFIFDMMVTEFNLKQYQMISHKLIPFAAMVALLWVSFRLINKFEEYWLTVVEEKKDSKWDETSIDATAKILRILVLVISGLIVMDLFGFNISGILALGGVGGVVVGFASKDLLANIFGALMIYLDKPFKIGDWIRITEKGVEGFVEKIGLRCTIIRTFDKRPLYLPNSMFTYVAIENPSRMSHRKIEETINLRLEDFKSVEKILKDIRDMLASHESLDHRQSYRANLGGFSNYSLNITIICFTKTKEFESFRDVKEDVLLKIGKIIASHKAQIASYYHV